MADPRALVGALLSTPSSTADVPWPRSAVDLARQERVHLLAAAAGASPELLSDWRDAVALTPLRERELTRVLDALHDADAPAIVIKGAALAHTHYPRPELRPRIDTDLMIAPDARARAAGTVEAIG